MVEMQSCQPLEAQISTQHLKNEYFPFKIHIFFNRPSFQIILFWDLIYVLTQRKCIGKVWLHTKFFSWWLNRATKIINYQFSVPEQEI